MFETTRCKCDSFQAVFSVSLAIPSFVEDRWQWVWTGSDVATAVANFAALHQTGGFPLDIRDVRGRVSLIMSLLL